MRDLQDLGPTKPFDSQPLFSFPSLGLDLQEDTSAGIRLRTRPRISVWQSDKLLNLILEVPQLSSDHRASQYRPPSVMKDF
jgi:hypothetical protein